jgi:cell division septum initiation protein DivIVA
VINPSSLENFSTGGQRRVPLSPDSIRRYPLNRTTFGRRGYVEEDVDRLLTRLARDVDGWVAENAELRAEIHRLKDWCFDRDRELPGQAADNDLPDVAAVNLLSRAQQEADTLLTQAQGYARQVAEHARRQYEDELRAAQAQAQEEAERAVRDYRSRSGDQYSAEFEELERRVAWVKAFLGAIQGIEVQLRAAREALTMEVNKLAERGGNGSGEQPIVDGWTFSQRTRH